MSKKPKSETKTVIITKPATPLAPMPPIENHPLALIHARKANTAAKRSIPITPEIKAEILERMSAGETMSTILADAHIPAPINLRYAAKADPVFGKQVDEALAQFADMLVYDGLQFALDAAATGNEKSMGVAERYARIAHAAAEKLSPRTHGPLLKVAGHDGGAIQVSLVNYANLATPLKSGDVPAEITDANFTDITPAPAAE